MLSKKLKQDRKGNDFSCGKCSVLRNIKRDFSKRLGKVELSLTYTCLSCLTPSFSSLGCFIKETQKGSKEKLQASRRPLVTGEENGSFSHFKIKWLRNIYHIFLNTSKVLSPSFTSELPMEILI